MRTGPARVVLASARVHDVSAEALCARFHKPFPRKPALHATGSAASRQASARPVAEHDDLQLQVRALGRPAGPGCVRRTRSDSSAGQIPRAHGRRPFKQARSARICRGQGTRRDCRTTQARPTTDPAGPERDPGGATEAGEQRAPDNPEHARLCRHGGHDAGPAPAGAGPAPGCHIPWQAWPARGSGGADAGGLGALRALGYLELHVLVLLQAAEAVAVDLGVVHEDVRPVGAGDEAVAPFSPR